MYYVFCVTLLNCTRHVVAISPTLSVADYNWKVNQVLWWLAEVDKSGVSSLPIIASPAYKDHHIDNNITSTTHIAGDDMHKYTITCGCCAYIAISHVF